MSHLLFAGYPYILYFILNCLFALAGFLEKEDPDWQACSTKRFDRRRRRESMKEERNGMLQLL